MTDLRARDLVVALGGVPVLAGVSLDVPAGSWLTVVGANGAGKSTLLRALAGLVPASGSVELGGAPAAGLRRREWARRVALVPQDPVVPAGMSVAGYVLLCRTPHLGPFGREGAGDLAVVARTLGHLVLTALADRPGDGVGTLNGQLTTVFEHRIQGTLFGHCNPFTDIPRLLRMHEEGRLELDRLITRRYSLDELAQGYRDQAAGETVRGLLVHA